MKSLIVTLNNLFNIRSHEWPTTLLLFGIAAITNAGFTLGLTIAYAAFLQAQGSGGLDALPWVLILIAVASTVATFLYTPFVDRVADDTLLNFIHVIVIAGIALGLGFLAMGYTFAYTFLYLWGWAVIAAINPHHATYFNSFFDIQAAKRTLPVVNAGYRAGGIAAGFSMPWLNRYFNNPAMIIMLWLGSMVVAMIIVWLLPRLVSSPAKPEVAHPEPPPSSAESVSFWDNTREGFRFTVQSPYLRWMAIATLLLTTLLPFLEYRSTELLLLEYNTATELADFLAMLVAVSNLIVVPLLLFGISRIIAALGLGNASLIFPTGNLIICTGLIFSPGWLSASAAYLGRTDFRLAFQFPVESLLYNAVSLKVKGRARAFASGLLAPLGQLLGGILLLILVIIFPLDWLMIALIGVLAVAYFGVMLIIRRLYSQALIKMLEQEDYSFIFAQNSSELRAVDSATLKSLEQRLTDSDDPELTIFMAQLISQLGGNQATAILSKAVEQAVTPQVRAGIVDVMVAADMQGRSVRKLYLNLLADPDGTVRQAALVGLERLGGVNDPQFLQVALPMLADPDIEVRTQLLLALAQLDDFYAVPEAVEALKQTLAQPDPYQVARGVLVLGHVADHCLEQQSSHHEDATRQLLGYLEHSDDRVRLQATLAVEQLTTHRIFKTLQQFILEAVAPLTTDPVERIRQATITIYSRIATIEKSGPLLRRLLTDESTVVRIAAAEAFVSLDAAAIPVLKPHLQAQESDIRIMAAIVLSRINPQEFGSHIFANITLNLQQIYQNTAYLQPLNSYQQFSSIMLLQDALREQNQRWLQEVFQLLSALHPPKSIKLVHASLQSQDERVRANALEALETLTKPQTARLIGPLTDPTASVETLLKLGQETWDINAPTPFQVVEQFATKEEYGWLQAIMIFILGEMGENQVTAAFTPTAKPEPPVPAEAPRRRKRARPQALLDSLFDSDNNTEDTAEEPPARASRRRKPVDLLAELSDDTTTPSAPTTPHLPRETIDQWVAAALTSTHQDVRLAAQSAQRVMAGIQIVDVRLAAYSANRLTTNTETIINEETLMLSPIEKIVFLKKVPFFQGMTIDQLKTLATVCEEELFEQDACIFDEGDAGGSLYVVVSGTVAIEQAGKRKGSSARIATLNAHAYFGEMTLFDDSPRTNAAIALQDTLTLQLRREPLVALARQQPELSLELINVLSQRLRDVSQQLGSLTRAKPRELHKLFDQYE